MAISIERLQQEIDRKARARDRMHARYVADSKPEHSYDLAGRASKLAELNGAIEVLADLLHEAQAEQQGEGR